MASYYHQIIVTFIVKLNTLKMHKIIIVTIFSFLPSYQLQLSPLSAPPERGSCFKIKLFLNSVIDEDQLKIKTRMYEITDLTKRVPALLDCV